VNSVCGALVQDYAFDLGLSPDMQVVDEPVAAQLLRESLSEDLTEEDAKEVAELARRLESFRGGREGEGWQEDVRRIVVLARTNGLEGERLVPSAEKSVEGLLKLFPPAGDGAQIEAGLL